MQEWPGDACFLGAKTGTNLEMVPAWELLGRVGMINHASIVIGSTGTENTI